VKGLALPEFASAMGQSHDAPWQTPLRSTMRLLAGFVNQDKAL
jgi:hypothetical protein